MRPGSHLVHHLGDRGPMFGSAVGRRCGEVAATAIVGGDRRRQRGAEECLVAVEAQVDDRDLHARPVVAGRVPDVCPGRLDALVHRLLDRHRRRSDTCHGAAGRQLPQRSGRNQRLHQTVGLLLDPAARGDHGGLGRRQPPGTSLNDHSNLPAADAEALGPGRGERRRRAMASPRVSDLHQPRIET